MPQLLGYLFQSLRWETLSLGVEFQDVQLFALDGAFIRVGQRLKTREGFWVYPSHSFTLNIRGKRAFCEAVKRFFGGKITYIEAVKPRYFAFTR